MLSKLTLPALLAVVPTLRFNFARMIALGDTLISEDVFEAMFACDLSKCKGACCVEGESGAPLEEDELEKIEAVFDVIKPHLRPEAMKVIEQVGLFEVDQDGDYVTPIINRVFAVVHCPFDCSFFHALHTSCAAAYQSSPKRRIKAVLQKSNTLI